VKEMILKNWESFESEISRVLGSVESKRAATKGYVSDPLFRGHADETRRCEHSHDGWRASADDHGNSRSP
jgi:hypothetical protein